jgi:hypothetical protein
VRPDTPQRLAWAGVLVWVLLLLLLFSTEDRSERLLRRGAGSTASSVPRGTQRLYAALRAVEAPVGRIRRGDVLPRDAAVLLVDPSAGVRLEQGPFRKSLLEGDLDLIVAGDRDQILAAVPWLDASAVPGTVDAFLGHPVAALPYSIALIGCDGTVVAFSHRPRGWTTLVETPATHPVVMTRVEGRGRITLVSDPRLFENGWVDQRDNARLALALAGARRSVIFDDRFAEAGALDPGTLGSNALLYGTPVGRSISATVLSLGLVLFLRGIRPGGIVRAARARPLAEFVHALADLLLASKRGGDVVAHFQRELRKGAARRFGLDPVGDPDALVDALAARAGRPREDILDLLTERPSRSRVAERVRALDDLRRMTGT